MLVQETIVPFLLQGGLLCEKQLVEGSVEIVSASRRNNNFKVTNTEGKSYLIKQGILKQNKDTIRRESEIYQFFKTTSLLTPLTELLPRFYGYDAVNATLITEMLDPARSYREHFLSTVRFPKYLNSELGKALGLLHSLTSRHELKETIVQRFPSHLPFIFDIYRPQLSHYIHSSPANIELIKIIQGSYEYYNSLKDCVSQWEECSLIHGDIKWENCMIHFPDIEKKRGSLKLIDWEYASFGDPDWDVAGVLSEYVHTWLLSVPLLPQNLNSPNIELAQIPLEKMQPAIKSFWFSYCKHAQISQANQEKRLIKAVRYAGARILQSTYEKLQSAHSVENQAIYSLQLSLNVMQQPDAAISELLKIAS